MLDSTVVCRRALGCEWGGGGTGRSAPPAMEKVRLCSKSSMRSITFLTYLLYLLPGGAFSKITHI